ncbi:MAG TPA: hypothetical protein VMV76_04865 [Dehalococcoidia bacterium]|nr:hypothetical protein [Dehalococcoidia bacterium]
MYERIREEIEQAIDYYDHRLAELIEDKQRELGNPKFMEITDLKAKAVGEAINQILSLDGIEIRSKDQSLPSVRNAVNKSYNDYMLGQEDMLKAGFVKVIPKRR